MREKRPNIRLATSTDLTDIETCARAAYAKYLERMDREPAPMNADFARQIAREQVHIAEIKGAVAGYVVFYPEGDHLHIENVAVLPSVTGRGVGKALIHYVEDTARERGFDAVELYTNEAMAENLSMYPSLGYTEIALRRESGFDRVFFRKPI